LLSQETRSFMSMLPKKDSAARHHPIGWGADGVTADRREGSEHNRHRRSETRLAAVAAESHDIDPYDGPPCTD
jgi:hypothetical protein